MRYLLLIPILLIQAGCAVSGTARLAGGSERGAGESGGVSLSWLRAFRDSEMVALAEEAVASNRDLHTLAIRLRAARETMVLAGAGRWPSVGLGASGSESGSAVRGSDGDLLPFEHASRFQGGMNLSWEADLWGRLANGERAVAADFQAQRAEFDGARLSLAAQTARAWCSLIAARQQLALATETRAGFERNLWVLERSFRNGDAVASALDVKFARNQVASAGRGVEVQKLAADEARRTLEILLGRYPAAAIAGRDRMPTLTNDVPSGLPAQLLERRPDLRAAAARIAAAGERAEAARKSLLPSISLTASGSAVSADLLRILTNPASLAASAAASLTQPVFRGGTLRASARQAAAQQEAAIEAFAAAALKAFREVESALAAGQSLERQYRLLETELHQAGLAERQASREYSEGIVGYLSVLEAQRRAVTARSQSISLLNARLQNRIDLYLTLGGDFR